MEEEVAAQVDTMDFIVDLSEEVSEPSNALRLEIYLLWIGCTI